MSDFGFVMLAFACIFILQAYQTAEPMLDDNTEKLNLVAAMAQLMIDLGPTSDHCAVLCGNSLQQRLKNVRQSMEKISSGASGTTFLDSSEASHDAFSTSQSIPIDHFEVLMNEEYQIDLSWEPSALFSEFLQEINGAGYA